MPGLLSSGRPDAKLRILAISPAGKYSHALPPASSGIINSRLINSDPWACPSPATRDFRGISIFPIFAFKPAEMDKRIYTLILIFVVYFLIAVNMLFFPTAQKFLTGMLFGLSGLALFFMFFGLWLLERKD